MYCEKEMGEWALDAWIGNELPLDGHGGLRNTYERYKREERIDPYRVKIRKCIQLRESQEPRGIVISQATRGNEPNKYRVRPKGGMIRRESWLVIYSIYKRLKRAFGIVYFAMRRESAVLVSLW